MGLIRMSSLLQVDQLRVTAEEEADFETKDIKFELKSLASIGDFTEADLPDEAQLAILDQYITSAEDYLQVWRACSNMFS